MSKRKPPSLGLDETIIADYPIVETSGTSRLILSLGDGRMFGVALPTPLGKGEPLPARAELTIPHLDDTGCPQGATFRRFLID
jgi:hypothetical protein